MGTETFLVILLVWSTTGLLAAIAFGKAIREPNGSLDQKTLAYSSRNIEHIRKNKRRVHSRQETARAA
jgi:hypothetical protein